MTWGAPSVLYALWLAPLLALGVLLAIRGRRSALQRLGPLIPSHTSVGALRTHTRRLTLLALAALLVLVALAQPRWGYRWEELKREGLSLVVVLDVSSSMAAQDVSPSRMERARREVLDLADLLEGDRVGLVLFAGGAYPRMPLTLDYDALRQMVKDSDVTTLAAQGSDLGGAIDAAVKLLGGPEGPADRAILIISDGEDQVGDATAAAQRAADVGVHLYTLGVGTTDGAPIPLPEGGFKKDKTGQMVLTKLDEDTLKEIARVASGAYARASAGAGDVRALYQDEIRGKLVRAEQGARREKIWDERYQWPLAGALVLALIATALRPGPLRLGGPAAGLLLVPWLLVGVGHSADPSEDPALKQLWDQHLRAPGDLNTAERLGEALYKAGDYKQAQEILEGVADRSLDGAQKARARYNSGLAAYRNGKLTEAQEDWKRVLQDQPEHAAAKQNADAVQKEIAMRLQQQQDQQQQGGQGQPQDQSQQQDQQAQDQQQSQQQGQQDQQAQNQQQGQQDQQDQQDPQRDQQAQDQQPGQQRQQSPQSDGTREERPAQADQGDDTGEQGQDAAAQQAEADDTGDEPSEAQAPPGSISASEASRMLDGVQEGDPRVTVKPRSRGGNDW